MKILHYALGFPPYRTGGLTKYCIDLMLTQKDLGHEVALLWPGQIGVIDKTFRIRKRKMWNGISSYEMINPLPIALDEGVKDIKAFTTPLNGNADLEFLKSYLPDVIHIHTLMGIHREFIENAKRLGIKMVFTTHDYYGLCPKVTLFRNGKVCDNDNNCINCISCNQTALSINKITILQSPFYRILKNTSAVSSFRKMHRNKFFKIPNHNYGDIKIKLEVAKEYKALRIYYLSMLKDISLIHFNSSVTERVYLRFLNPIKSKTVSISHRDIADNRSLRSYENVNLRITYLGPAKPFKGFQFLLSILDALWARGTKNFELHIFASSNEERPYITQRQDGYSYNQLEGIFEETDLVVAPSLWYETYGFTVLESISYGVPVLVSENVGAKDVVGAHSLKLDKIVFMNQFSDLCHDKSILKTWNQEICESEWEYTAKYHAKIIEALYRQEDNNGNK